MSWEKTTIGEHCTVTSSRRFHLSERTNSGVPFYCSKEIIQKVNGDEVTDCDYISEDLYESVKKQFGVPEAGELLITTRGTYGIPYIYRDTDRFYFADGNLTWLKDFDETLLPKYLYYWVKSFEGQSKIDAIAKGTAQKAVPIALIKTLDFMLPPIDHQRKIVEILSAYDDLIENNRRQIKLLEEAARRLYREWFVDFRFPGHEQVQIVDGVPEGWKKSEIGNICKIIKNTYKIVENDDTVPYIGLEHIPRNSLCLNEWGFSNEVNSNKFTFVSNDILFGKIRPYFHKVGFAICCGVCSTDAIVMRPLDKFFSLLLMIASSDDFVDYAYQTCKEGAKMPRADWNTMKKYHILIANNEVMEQFNRLVTYMTSEIKALSLQNRALAEARNRLLGELMD